MNAIIRSLPTIDLLHKNAQVFLQHLEYFPFHKMLCLNPNIFTHIGVHVSILWIKALGSKALLLVWFHYF